jgi:predicted double-glycine peptidase
VRIKLSELRRLIVEQAQDDEKEEFDYGIPGNAPKCPAVPTISSTDVNVPDIEDWEKKVTIPVPLLHQAASWSCGAAALQASFLYWMPNDYPYETEVDMWEDLNTTEENGTEPTNIVNVARASGLAADYYSDMSIDDVRKHFNAKKTVILCFQAWPGRRIKGWEFTWIDGHYAVLVGIDNDNVYMMDPSTHSSYVWLPIPELIKRWHDVDEGVPKFGLGIVISGQDPRRDFPGTLKRLC